MRSCVAIEMSGMTEAWNLSRIYVDSNVFVYALEGTPKLALLLEQAVRSLSVKTRTCCNQRA
jgi:hypothetical protein